MSDTTDAPDSATLPRPIITRDHCKGCGRCIDACPKKVLRFSETLNRRSVHTAEYIGSGCIGCGICYYNCPEPFAIEVHTADKKTK